MTPAVLTAAALLERGVISFLDFELSQALLGIVNEQSAEVELGAALASWAVQRGHVCVDLKAISGQSISNAEGEPLSDVAWPKLESWISELSKSALVQTESATEAVVRPLVLVGRRLYLARYFAYEQRLAHALLQQSRIRHPPAASATLLRDLDALFPPTGGGAEGQRRACVLALLRGLCVITGGPGTGKTTGVAKLLVLLQQQALAQGNPPLKIQLMAPTGKAAERLGEAMQRALAQVPAELRVALPNQATTLHRALGYQRRTPTKFRHNKQNPLDADVVVVDETSMVDLALMTKLVEAVPPNARLLLLGDKDQLASVEAGVILGDLCSGNPGDGFSAPLVAQVEELLGEAWPVSALKPAPGLHDCMLHLSHVYRFEQQGPIARLAAAVNAGNGDEALSVLERGGDAVRFIEIDATVSPEALFGEVLREQWQGLGSVTPAEKLAVLRSFRFLCAHRKGPLGVEALNRFVAAYLTRREVLAAGGDWYEGRPILVTANDYSLDLYNGDVGVIAPAGAAVEGSGAAAEGRGSAPLVAWFTSSSGQLRAIPTAQLPVHETVFAMSVHKSQGSELGHVALVLPERVSPVVTRELIYTAITRAQHKVSIFGSKAVFIHAIQTPVQRASGLADSLWAQDR